MKKLELVYLNEFENEARVIYLKCPCEDCDEYLDTIYLVSDVLKEPFAIKIDPNEIMPVFTSEEIIGEVLVGDYMLIDIITGDFCECDLCSEYC